MARETKISLLVGMVIILLIGILVSDHLSSASKQEHGSLTGAAGKTQKSISSDIARNDHTPAIPLPPGGEATFADGPRGHNAIEPQSPARMDVVPPPLNSGIGAGMTPAGKIGQEQDPISGMMGNREAIPTSAFQPPPVKPMTPSEPAPLATHVVQKGDTLYKLAARYYHDASSWKLIQDANAAAIQANGGNLKNGTTLTIPHRPFNAPEAPTGNGGTLTKEQPGLFDRVTPDSAPGADDGVPVRIIEVQAGQNLMALAGQHMSDKNRWKEILDANKDQIRKPEDLKIGMKLKVPTASRSPRSDSPSMFNDPAPTRTAQAPKKVPQSYTVRPGDTLYSISARHMGDRGRWKEILAMNRGKLDGPSDLQIGQTIRLPSSGSR